MQHSMNRVKELKVYELVVPNDQLRLWQGLVNGDVEEMFFENRNEDIITQHQYAQLRCSLIAPRLH